MPSFNLDGRMVGDGYPPLVIAECGIAHEGSLERARDLVGEVSVQNAPVVKFQCHIPDAEMLPDCEVYGTVSRCSLDYEQECALKAYTEASGLTFMSTPFSTDAALRLEAMGVKGYKIGSGEANNLPLLELVASFGKPVLLSTGTHSTESIRPSVELLRTSGAPYALMHCTSEYPTQYHNVRLGALAELREAYPDAVIGLSDHALGIHTSTAAVALGASIVEKHVGGGPDAAVSISMNELGELVRAVQVIHRSLGGSKTRLATELGVAAWAYSSVVTRLQLFEGDTVQPMHVTVKRPGGGIPAAELSRVIGRKAKRDIPPDQRLKWGDLE